VTHTEGFFFSGGGRREAIDAIFEGVYRADVVLLLVGAAGSGRSAVINHFCEEADPQVLSVAVIAGDILTSPDQALAGLCSALEMQVVGDPRNVLWRAVEWHRGEGRNVVLIVDDAHELGIEVRAAIVDFAHDAKVALVLVGDESLAPGMDPEVAFDVIALRPLSEDESEQFVAGWLGVDDEDELPSHRVMARLHRHSAGLPGRLAGLLGAGAAERAALLPNRIPFWHAMIAVVAIALLAVLLGHALFGGAPGAPVQSTEVEVPLPHPDQLAAERQSGESPEHRVVTAAVPQPLDVKPFVPQLPVATTDTQSAVAAAAPPAPAVPAPQAEPEPQLPTAAPGARLSAMPARTLPVSGNQLPTPAARYSADEQKLLAEPRSRFTVQLFASFNEQAVRQFRARHAETDIRIFRTLREELPWYVAVTGSFRNREEARVAVTRLPVNLQELTPWARSLQSIQDELRRRKD